MIGSSSENRDAASIVESLHQRNVRLSLKDGELHFAAPKGALSREDLGRISASRADIIAYLAKSPEGGGEIGRRMEPARAPLAFSQLKHCRFHSASGRPQARDVASAIKLHGLLDEKLMAASLAKVVERHEALRTKIVLIDGQPEQQVAISGNWELQATDLRGLLKAERDEALRRQIDDLILAPVRFESGPLFGVRLVTLEEDEHVLIVATEHVISDAVSVNIVLRDLLEFYLSAATGRTPNLPSVALQFSGYAIRQQQGHAAWLRQHGAYWDARLEGCSRLRFPEDAVPAAGPSAGWDVVSLEISADLKSKLRESCRRARTTLVMGMFAAYAAAVMYWCDVSDAVIGYQIDGRTTRQVQDTVGFFACALYLRIGLRPGITFTELMTQVTDEYGRAYDHADFSYIDTRQPSPRLVNSTLFNWVPQPEENPNAEISAAAPLRASPFPFENPSYKRARNDREPLILLADIDGRVAVDIHFPGWRFRKETMERLARNYFAFLTRLARDPGGDIMGAALD